MYRRVKNAIAGALVGIALMGCLLVSHAYAQIANGQKVETKGLIVTRDGENMTIQTRDMGTLTVVLAPDTKVQVPKGIFRHKEMEVTSLMPGLEVEVEGTGNENGQVVAKTVDFTNESLRIAKQANAALTVTRAQTEANRQGVAANTQGIAANTQEIASNASSIDQHTRDIQAAEKRFADLTEFSVKKDLTINFATGKSNIPDDAQRQLTELVAEAKGLKGYLIEVRGFASTSGNAQLNQQLSQDRAEAVVAFLQQQGIDLRHIVNEAAMGTTSPVAANETEEGRLQNQRVEVKLMVNKGLNSSIRHDHRKAQSLIAQATRRSTSVAFF